MTKKPEGAVGITEARTSKGPWYVVYTSSPRYGPGTLGHLEKRPIAPGRMWFDETDYGEIKLGYCFLNYYHALAFSLKCKDAAHTAKE